MKRAHLFQYVFDHMAGAFTHKLWHVREGVLVCLQNTINRYRLPIRHTQICVNVYLYICQEGSVCLSAKHY